LSFIDDFLNVILAEASMASIVHLLESRNGLCLTRRHYADFFHVPVRSLGGLMDAIKNRLQRRRCATR
jgi:hypothetical protein